MLYDACQLLLWTKALGIRSTTLIKIGQSNFKYYVLCNWKGYDNPE